MIDPGNATSPGLAGCQTERKLEAPLLPALASLFAVLYALTGYRGWLVFLLGTAGLWFLAAWWTISLERGLRINRRIHLAWAGVGQSVPEQLEVTNRSRFPALWLEIFDESEASAKPLCFVTDVGAHTTRRRHPVHQFSRRGLYSLGPTRLRTGDPFGVYTLTIRNRHSTAILVTPPQLSLARVDISPGGWTGDRKRRSPALAREISDGGLRHYLPGDSLKRIHWPASAHLDALVVRRLEAAAAEDWWIFLDLEEKAQRGTGQDSTVELSIVLAASLAMRGLREHRRVGLALMGKKPGWLQPRADAAHRWRILQVLATAEPGGRSLKELLSAGRPAQTASLIVITPSTDPGWVARAAKHVRTGSVTALLVDPSDFGAGADQGKVSTALARSRIRFVRMPGTLLGRAYSATRGSLSKGVDGADPRRHYLPESQSTWQRMN